MQGKIIAAATPWLHDLRGTEAAVCLPVAVDPPLETSEGTDHDDTGDKTLGEQVDHTHLGGHLSPSLVLVGDVTLHGHEVVHGLGGDGAEDTGEVTAAEGDGELLALAVIFLGLALGLEQVRVDGILDLVETNELDHGVRDLATPQRSERSEGESGVGLVGVHGAHDTEHTRGELRSLGGAGKSDLHLDLGHLERAESDVGEDLGGTGGSTPKRKAGNQAVVDGVSADNGGVQILEELVETELEKTLGTIAEEGGDNTLGDTSNALELEGLLDGLDEARGPGTAGGVGLGAALRDVKGDDGSVGETAGKDTTGHALGIVVGGVEPVLGGAAGSCENVGHFWRAGLGPAHLLIERKKKLRIRAFETLLSFCGRRSFNDGWCSSVTYVARCGVSFTEPASSVLAHVARWFVSVPTSRLFSVVITFYIILTTDDERTLS